MTKTILTVFLRHGVYRTRNFQIAVRISPRVICKQPWASSQSTACSSQLSLLPSAGWENELRGEGL